MAQQSITITAKLTVTTRRQLVEDSRENTLTVTVSDGQNGWQNVIVTEVYRPATPISPAVAYSVEYGFLPSAYSETRKPRWSYNNRPPRAIIDARKALRPLAQPTAESAPSPMAAPAPVAASAPKRQSVYAERRQQPTDRQQRREDDAQFVLAGGLWWETDN